jgi:hypothetical protein
VALPGKQLPDGLLLLLYWFEGDTTSSTSPDATNPGFQHVQDASGCRTHHAAKVRTVNPASVLLSTPHLLILGQLALPGTILLELQTTRRYSFSAQQLDET